MEGLADKIVVVAGGATGIGAVTASNLARHKARVVIGDLNLEAAESVAKDVRNAGGDAQAFRFDISAEEQCSALIDFAVRTYGGVDGLFNVAADTSAGTLGRDTNLLDVPIEVWKRTIDVDLTGYFYTARAALPALLERGGGAIVNTISGLVLQGDPIRVSYGAAKGGIVPLTKHIATRWGREGIRCNAVAPGLVVTEQSAANVSPDEHERLLALVRSPRLGRPEDIASAVSFLLSDQAAWINGQVLPVNGGTGLR